MSMYPCIALIAGLIWDRWSGPVGDAIAGTTRKRLTCLGAGLAAVLAVVVGALGFVPAEFPRWLEEIRPGTLTALATLVAGLAAAACLWTAAQRNSSRSDEWVQNFAGQRAILSMVALLGVIHVGLVTDVFVRRSVDLEGPIAGLHEKLVGLGDKQLVSLGAIHHRFAWYYPEAIPQQVWPEKPEDLPPDVEYFCFDVCPWDTPEKRQCGRGLDIRYTNGTLPFEWELVTRIVVESVRKHESAAVIVGRVVRDPDPRNTRAADAPLRR
jgi:hypothetical protein